MEGLLLDQLPPGTALVKVTQLPLHKDAVPEMAAGDALTVTTVVIKQVEARVFVIVAVPVDTPVTMPDADPIVAIAVLLLDQVPGPGHIRVVVAPAHVVLVPEMKKEMGACTVTGLVA
jgi:hypothetical protein